MPTYTRTMLKASVNSRIHNKIGILSDSETTLNNGVREAITFVDFRSMKRKSSLAPNLFNDIYHYTCPTDLKGMKIVDLQPQTGERSKFNDWELTTESEFDRQKETKYNLLAFSDRDFTRKLLVSASVNDDGFTVSPLDALTGGGTWALFGDGTNVTQDSYEYVKGSASINFDISAAGGTTAGIQSSDIPTFDPVFLSQLPGVFALLCGGQSARRFPNAGRHPRPYPPGGRCWHDPAGGYLLLAFFPDLALWLPRNV